jgi:hypothetical protein
MPTRTVIVNHNQSSFFHYHFERLESEPKPSKAYEPVADHGTGDVHNGRVSAFLEKQQLLPCHDRDYW